MTNQLQTLFEKHYQKLCASARKLVGKKYAHDIVMDVFVYVLEHPNYITNRRTAENYLSICVRNKCIDVLRRSTIVDQNGEIPCDEELTEDLYSMNNSAIENKLVIKEVFKAISALPPQQRQVIELSLLEDATREEVAEIMEISKNTVKNHKLAAIKSLKLKLKID